MRYKVEKIGWGIYRMDGRIWVWDDYPDDAEHDGYGVLVRGDGKERKEIVRNFYEGNEVVEVELRDFEWEG